MVSTAQTVKPMSQEVIDKVIPGEERITCRYADLLDNEMDKLEGEMKEWKQQDEDVLSYAALFPQVATDSSGIVRHSRKRLI